MIGRITTCLGVLGLGVLGSVGADTLLVRTIAWGLVLLAVLAGCGSLVTRACRLPDPGASLRALWGGAAYVAVTGVLVALGVCTQAVVLALIAVGAAAFCVHELTTPAPLARDLAAFIRRGRTDPWITLATVAVLAIVAFHIVASATDLRTNASDDDVAYSALLRRLLDVGNLDEPFSFRRMAAYGGQTVLRALDGARGGQTSVHLVDRGVFQALTVMLVIGLAHGRTARARGWLLLVLLMVALLRNYSLNTASYWSGVAFCLGLYRTLAAPDHDAPTRLRPGHTAIVAIVAASTCALRHSYLPVVAIMLVASLAFRLGAARRTLPRAAAWRQEGRTWGQLALIGTACALPWMIASWGSNGTILYPMFHGDFAASISMRPHGASWAHEGAVFVELARTIGPIQILPVVFVVLAMTRDRRAMRPLVGLGIASLLGFVMLVHGFLLADMWSLWRYGVGPFLALTLALAGEAGAREPSPTVRIGDLARSTLGLALVAQLLLDGRSVLARAAADVATIDLAAGYRPADDPRLLELDATYQVMQASIPPGAAVAVLVEQPFRLDYARNQIFNLDTPGLAGPGPGMPRFGGPEAMRAYLLGQGIRYLAVVRSHASRIAFSWYFWAACVAMPPSVWRIVRLPHSCVAEPGELAQIVGVYMLDALETFDALAASRPLLFDRAGMVVIDLGSLP